VKERSLIFSRVMRADKDADHAKRRDGISENRCLLDCAAVVSLAKSALHVDQEQSVRWV